MDRQHEYEFKTYGKTDKHFGNVWWDGKRIQSDKPLLLNMIKRVRINGLTFDDGVEFLQALPQHYRSYMIAQKVK